MRRAQTHRPRHSGARARDTMKSRFVAARQNRPSAVSAPAFGAARLRTQKRTTRKFQLTFSITKLRHRGPLRSIYVWGKAVGTTGRRGRTTAPYGLPSLVSKGSRHACPGLQCGRREWGRGGKERGARARAPKQWGRGTTAAPPTFFWCTTGA